MFRNEEKQWKENFPNKFHLFSYSNINIKVFSLNLHYLNKWNHYLLLSHIFFCSFMKIDQMCFSMYNVFPKMIIIIKYCPQNISKHPCDVRSITRPNWNEFDMKKCMSY